jgi:hypothetical protein
VAFRSRQISLVDVVAPVFALFVFIYLCAGEDRPPSFSNIDEGCQWETQTDEGLVPYWNSVV